MSGIHPLAVVSPLAHVGRDVTIGPFCVIDDHVQLGDGCWLGSHVAIKPGVVLGRGNKIHDGAVLGGPPQHATAAGPFGKLVVGEGNVIRECVTMHVAMHADRCTTIGDHNLFMVGSHVGHDSVVGNHAVLVNHVLLGGHVTVEDRAYLGGGVGVHQFCRIGRNCMIGAHARIVQDVPPFVMVDGDSAKIVGLNLVGLRRAGYSREDIDQLKAAYRVVYRAGLLWDDILAALGEQFTSGPAALFQPFFAAGNRGFIQERRAPPRATLRIAPGESADTAEAAESDTPPTPTDAERPIRRVG